MNESNHKNFFQIIRSTLRNNAVIFLFIILIGTLLYSYYNYYQFKKFKNKVIVYYRIPKNISLKNINYFLNSDKFRDSLMIEFYADKIYESILYQIQNEYIMLSSEQLNKIIEEHIKNSSLENSISNSISHEKIFNKIMEFFLIKKKIIFNRNLDFKKNINISADNNIKFIRSPNSNLEFLDTNRFIIYKNINNNDLNYMINLLKIGFKNYGIDFNIINIEPAPSLQKYVYSVIRFFFIFISMSICLVFLINFFKRIKWLLLFVLFFSLTDYCFLNAGEIQILFNNQKIDAQTVCLYLRAHISSHPEDIKSKLYLGFILKSLKQHNEALGIFKEILDNKNNTRFDYYYYLAYTYLSNIYIETGDMNKYTAVQSKYYNKILSLPKKEYPIIKSLTELNIQIKNFDYNILNKKPEKIADVRPPASTNSTEFKNDDDNKNIAIQHNRNIPTVRTSKKENELVSDKKMMTENEQKIKKIDDEKNNDFSENIEMPENNYLDNRYERARSLKKFDDQKFIDKLFEEKPENNIPEKKNSENFFVYDLSEFNIKNINWNNFKYEKKNDTDKKNNMKVNYKFAVLNKKYLTGKSNKLKMMKLIDELNSGSITIPVKKEKYFKTAIMKSNLHYYIYPEIITKFTELILNIVNNQKITGKILSDNETEKFFMEINLAPNEILLFKISDIEKNKFIAVAKFNI